MKILGVTKTAFKRWNEKDPFRESAIIAYYSIFSLPGLFLVILTLAGVFFGREIVDGYLLDQITSSLGEDTAKQINNIIAQQEKTTSTGSFWGTLIGIGTLILGATGVFAQFQKSLNNIWDVKADPAKSGILMFLKARLFSFGLIVAVAFLLTISLLISTLITAFGDWMTGNFSDSLKVVVLVINFVVSLAILTVLFALMLKVFPDAKIKWKDVWLGSFVTAILFDIGKFGLSFYFGKAEPASAYGAAGSIILILLWVSYSSMIVFYGAEFTRAYADAYTGHIEPAEYAEKKEPCEGKPGESISR